MVCTAQRGEGVAEPLVGHREGSLGQAACTSNRMPTVPCLAQQQDLPSMASLGVLKPRPMFL